MPRRTGLVGSSRQKVSDQQSQYRVLELESTNQLGLKVLYAPVIGPGSHKLVERRVCILLALESIQTVRALIRDVLTLWSAVKKIKRLSVLVSLK